MQRIAAGTDLRIAPLTLDFEWWSLPDSPHSETLYRGTLNSEKKDVWRAYPQPLKSLQADRSYICKAATFRKFCVSTDAQTRQIKRAGGPRLWPRRKRTAPADIEYARRLGQKTLRQAASVLPEIPMPQRPRLVHGDKRLRVYAFNKRLDSLRILAGYN